MYSNPTRGTTAIHKMINETNEQRRYAELANEVNRQALHQTCRTGFNQIDAPWFNEMGDVEVVEGGEDV